MYGQSLHIHGVVYRLSEFKANIDFATTSLGTSELETNLNFASTILYF